MLPGLIGHSPVSVRLRGRRRAGAVLLLLQLWLACALPLLHARQESRDQARAPVVGEGRGLAGVSHGAGCVVCALVATPVLAGVAITASAAANDFLLSHAFARVDHPLYQAGLPLGPRAPPQL